MEKLPVHGPQNYEFKREDIYAFGRFLADARRALGKKVEDIAAELGFGHTVIRGWEANTDALAFPTEDKLPRIAEIYKVDLAELTSKLLLSKKARQEEKSFLKKSRAVPKPRRISSDW